MAATHGSKADVLGNGYTLSTYFNSATFAGSRDAAETTTFKKESKTYIPGLKDNSMSIEGVYDGAADAVDEVLWAAFGAGAGVFSYFPTGQEVFGNMAFTMDAIETSYEINTDVGDVAQISAELQMGDSGIFDRGHVYHPMAVEAAPGNTASRDNAAQTLTGAALTIHATASATLVGFLQDSADNTAWADLAGSLAFGATRGSKRLIITGTIRRYLRVRWTGSGTFHATAARL